MARKPNYNFERMARAANLNQKAEKKNLLHFDYHGLSAAEFALAVHPSFRI